MTWGERLRTIRKSRKVSQAELADMIGRKQNQISDWEKDKIKMRVDDVVLMCKALDIEFPVFMSVFEGNKVYAEKDIPKQELLNRAEQAIEELQELIRELKG